jgi:uncharacterized protein (TIGR03086 family)
MTFIDRRPLLARAYANAQRVAGGVGPDQLSRATPCAKLDVAALIDHLVGAAGRAAAIGRGQTPTGEEFPHVELADAPRELGRAAEEAEAAWADDDRMEATVTMPWGEVYTGATLVDMYSAELAAHAWDLAVATEQLDRLDPDLAEPALEAAHSFLKPEYRDLMEPGSPFGAEVLAPTGGDAWTRFAAFMGRSVH